MQAPAERPQLSVLIVSWNVRDHVLRCLAALHADPTAPTCEVILVDNASVDDTVDAVRAQYPDTCVIANEVNVGFPRANNQALAYARGATVLYLNPDTEVQPGTLRRCYDELARNPALGAVGCRLQFADGTVQYDGARNAYRLRHLAGELLYLHMLFPRHPVLAHHVMGDWDHRGVRDVEAICGAFMMTPASAARAIGGLPEDVFMYHEDLSFCLRLRRAGCGIRYLGDVATVHHTKQSSSRSDAELGLLEAIAKHLLIREAEGPAYAATARGLIAVRSLLRLPAALAMLLAPRRLRERYPRVADLRLHLLQLVWAVSPRLLDRRIPRAPASAPQPRQLDAHVAGAQ